MESNAAILILAADPGTGGYFFRYSSGPFRPHYGFQSDDRPTDSSCWYVPVCDGRVAGLSFEEQLRGTAIFYIPLIITLIVITMVPQVTLFLIG